MAAPTHAITINQGATFRSNVILRSKATGDLIPLPNHTARAQIRATIDSGTILHEMTTANGGLTVTDPGVIEMYISDTDTAGFSWTTGVYDLELEDTVVGDVLRVIQGPVTVDQEVTR